MKLYTCEKLDPVGVSFKGVKSIVDTSGFMPLETKVKQFMLNGQIANLRASLFDSYDFREMFDSIPEIVDDAFDDLEEVNLKLHAINSKRAEIIARKLQVKDKVSVHDNDEKKSADADQTKKESDLSDD